jgi:alpha-amylase/alpha-mannosidase (GH57 family)
MVYLAFIFHMHQPYYKNLLTGESALPWVRLHGCKDYLDMVKILEKFPAIHQTFNLVPSLLEQIEDYTNNTVKDKYLELSYKPAGDLTREDKEFLLQNFFSINCEKVISCHPRYYYLYFMKTEGEGFDTQDYLDLQVWFNLAWIDPYFRESIPELKRIVDKARFYNEEDKRVVLEKQIQILKDILPAYRKAIASGQIEATVTPFYHPILPLLYSTNTAKEANPRTVLPKIKFSYPQDAKAQVDSGVKFFEERFGQKPAGMWPSEESVCEHILPILIGSGINWIVTDEAILFKSLKRKKRDTNMLYQPHCVTREEGKLNIIFRDRNLSDLLGFVYYNMKAEIAVADFMKHLQDIAKTYKSEDVLVAIAMDGENAWEFYTNDGHDFLELLYRQLSEATFVKTTTVSEYLKTHPPKFDIKRLAAGSWIYGEFGKWIGNPYKVLAWEWLARARKELQDFLTKEPGNSRTKELALKQMHILEGSDWYWWAGEDPNGDFDRLFRMHLTNFYNIIGIDPPEYLNKPLKP